MERHWKLLRHSALCQGHLDAPTGPERGLSRLSSPQQRRTAGGLPALTGTVRSARVAADWKVRAPVGVSRRCAPLCPLAWICLASNPEMRLDAATCYGALRASFR